MASLLRSSQLIIAMDRGAILIFSRAPIPGCTKRRLIPALGEEGAAILHQRMLEHLLHEAEKTGFEIELWCTPTIEHPFFLRLEQDRGIRLYYQEGGDLGARMAFVLEQGMQRYERVLLVGTDCPFLTAADLQMAMQKLQGPEDVVMGRARDGGYVFIGLSQPCHLLFEGILWGSEKVAEQTRQRAEESIRRCHELGPFQDIDHPEDLLHLREAFGSWVSEGTLALVS